MADDDTTYCAWEQRRVPTSEFEERVGHGLVHFKNVSQLHTASGIPVDDPPAAGGGGGGGGGGSWNAPADMRRDLAW